MASSPVALIVASRVEESPPGLEALRAQAGVLLHVAPLGEDSAAIIVRAVAPAADDALCRAYHAATGGNPFLLHELARSMVDGAVSAERVAEQSPERVTREIAGRLGSLPAAARELAQAAAVLGPGASLRQAAALATIHIGAAADAADALVYAGVLRSAHPLFIR